MSGLLWVAESILLGCLLVWRWRPLVHVQPRWARLLLIFGAGAAGGMGLTSCLFFLIGVLAGSPIAAMAVELALLAWAAFDAYRNRNRTRAPHDTSAMRAGLLLPVLLVAVVGIATAAMASGWEANPRGNWDAWAIWNLRARFLAAGPGMAERTWSPALGAATHPEYPLLLSGFVGRCWEFSHSDSPVVPASTSWLFFMALIALVTGGVAALRGPPAGLLAGMVIAASPALVHEVPAQYADVPLACYFAAAVLFALLHEPALAGVFAGLAAWTKDEGLLFLLLFLVAVAAFRRKAIVASIAGAMPAGLLALIFRMTLPRGSSSLLAASAHGAAHRLAELSRNGDILMAFAKGFAGMGVGWYHPVEPIIVAAIVLRFHRGRARDAAFAGAIGLALLLGYFGVYAVTSNDLSWQLSTSLDRLLVQVWPLLAVAAFLGMRAPRTAPAPAAPSKKSRRKATHAR